MKNKSKEKPENEEMTRIAIVNPDRCKPKKCNQECKKNCPVVRQGKLCIEVEPTDPLSTISESLCIGCGICVKRCPFDAIRIINLPSSLGSETTHRFGPNSFKLHRLPVPRPGEILGLVGTNGIGKSTALKILSGRLKLNLGQYSCPPEWSDIVKYFRGSELQGYFKQLIEGKIKAVMKPQYVDLIPRSSKGRVSELIKKRCTDDKLFERMVQLFDLSVILDRDIENLSGGELQRVACAAACVQSAANVLIFDEPSSYLDIKQRLKAAAAIRECVRTDRYILVVEHDLSVLDYLSDFICCLYGNPGAYGVVTLPFGVREGINVFLDGFIPTENMRFRNEQLVFRIDAGKDAAAEESIEKHRHYSYPAMSKTLGPFKLTIEQGDFTDSEIVVMLGENGTGKTTFIRMLAGFIEPDEGSNSVNMPKLNVSHKPQKISPKSQMSVRRLLATKINPAFNHPQFNTDVLKPLMVDQLYDLEVQNLSGGELQRVAIALCLGKPADIYLIDEPSAYLDSEQRVIAAKVIKRFIMGAKKTAFIVEHDFIMATYLADRVVVFGGQPAVLANASAPQTLMTGMNAFLRSLDITFRRDPNNYRPRINKLNSQKDSEQKRDGNYFFIETL